MTIHDLAGREVLTKSPLKQKLWLNSYSLSSGVYLLNVQTAEGEQTVKIGEEMI
ncbi:MAG: T9SS type A sorting domain-containing protein [Flavobacteriaceae bacterium]